MPSRRRPTSAEHRVIEAAKAGDLAQLREWLPIGGARGADSVYGRTALLWAARNGHADCVQELLPVSYVKKIDDSGTNALNWAAFEGHVDCVRALIGRLDPNIPDRKGNTPLMVAVKRRQVECVRALAPVSDLAMTNDREETAFILAAEASSLDCLRLLLPGSDKNATDQDGQTALMRAAVPPRPRGVGGAVSEPDAIACLDFLIAAQCAAEPPRASGLTPFGVARAHFWRAGADALSSISDPKSVQKAYDELGSDAERLMPRWSSKLQAEELGRIARISSSGLNPASPADLSDAARLSAQESTPKPAADLAPSPARPRLRSRL